MAEILTFRPRPKPAAPPAPAPLTDAALRTRIEAAAETAVDTAERLIALLDRMDGEPDLEAAEPSLAAPETPGGSRVVWMRGADRDSEAVAPEPAAPEVAIEADTPAPAPVPIPHPPLPWRGRGNVVAAAGVALLDLIERPTGRSAGRTA